MQKFSGWAKTRQPFSAVSGPKFTKFLSDCWYHTAFFASACRG